MIQFLNRFFIIALLIASNLSFAGEYNPIFNRANCIETMLNQVFVHSNPIQRNLGEISEGKIMTFNSLNMEASVGKQEKLPNGTFKMVSGPSEKDIAKIAGMKRMLLKENPDFIIWQEIEGGTEVLDGFMNKNLPNKYKNYVVFGNDGRGINIGFSAKSDLSIKVKMETHRTETWKDGDTIEPLFSRDLPAMLVWGEKQNTTEKPMMIILGNHGKSKRFRSPLDLESSILRSEQLKRSAKIINDYKQKYGEDVNIVMGGDFNTQINSAEVKPLVEVSQMSEGFSLIKNAPPEEERFTHIYFPPKGAAGQYHQMDALFFSSNAKNFVKDGKVVRYYDESGKLMPIPKTYEERELQVSDHFPVMFTIDFKKMVEDFTAKKIVH